MFESTLLSVMVGFVNNVDIAEGPIDPAGPVNPVGPLIIGILFTTYCDIVFQITISVNSRRICHYQIST